MPENTVVFPKMESVRQAAEMSGLAVYRIRRLVAENKVSHVYAGRRILVNLDDLAAYLSRGDTGSADVKLGIRPVG